MIRALARRWHAGRPVREAVVLFASAAMLARTGGRPGRDKAEFGGAAQNFAEDDDFVDLGGVDLHGCPGDGFLPDEGELEAIAAEPAGRQDRAAPGPNDPDTADRPIGRLGLAAKTWLDRVLACFLLIGLSPLLLAIAIAIAASSPGPVIFRQLRHGWQGRDFIVLKFRTMRFEPGQLSSRMPTRRHDPRCTPVGRVLRAYSLDELPQLWNVVRGEMSLVGPRPLAGSLHEIDMAGGALLAAYAMRHRVKPGITGWAQINGLRGAMATVEQLRSRVAFDLYYIEHWSFWLDLKILALTPFCMGGENVF